METDLQITIVQTEIERAIVQFLLGKISVNPDQQVTVDLSATRGAEGFKATINITDKGEAVPAQGNTLSATALLSAMEAVSGARATGATPMVFGRPRAGAASSMNTIKPEPVQANTDVDVGGSTTVNENGSATTDFGDGSIGNEVADDSGTTDDTGSDTGTDTDTVEEPAAAEEVAAEAAPAKPAGNKRSLFKGLSRPGSAQA